MNHFSVNPADSLNIVASGISVTLEDITIIGIALTYMLAHISTDPQSFDDAEQNARLLQRGDQLNQMLFAAAMSTAVGQHFKLLEEALFEEAPEKDKVDPGE